MWFTCLPAPAGFDGFARGAYGWPGYWRTCTREEADRAAAHEAAVIDRLRRHEARMRDDFLAGDDAWSVDADDDVGPPRFH